MNLTRSKVVKLKPEVSNNFSFYNVIGPCLVYGQIFGMIPANGVMSNDENKVEFRWTSLRTIYSMVFLFCCTSDCLMGVLRLLRRGFSIYQFEGLIFFVLATIRGFIFFHLAIKWKKIMSKWRKCEEPFLSAPYRVKGWNLSRRIRIIFIVLALLGIGEEFYLTTENFGQFFPPFQLSTFFIFQMSSTTISFRLTSATLHQMSSGTIFLPGQNLIFVICLAIIRFCCLSMK